MDVYDVIPVRVRRFDVVLFLGVLYHLKHPLLALERVCAVTTDTACIESFVLRDTERPLLEFCETSELGGQTDNWVAPSLSCLLAFCRTAGFARVVTNAVHDYGAAVTCCRRWEAPPAHVPAGPPLLGVAHDRNFGMDFHSQSDEYVVCVLQSSEPLARDVVKPEVGGLGAVPISVMRLDGDRWQANFKLPPGLPPGWHDVRLIHSALPEVDLDEIDTGVELLGHRLRLPLVIASMTGGHPTALGVNRLLARAAEQFGAFAHGNQAKPTLRSVCRHSRAVVLDLELEPVSG